MSEEAPSTALNILSLCQLPLSDDDRSLHMKPGLLVQRLELADAGLYTCTSHEHSYSQVLARYRVHIIPNHSLRPAARHQQSHGPDHGKTGPGGGGPTRVPGLSPAGVSAGTQELVAAAAPELQRPAHGGDQQSERGPVLWAAVVPREAPAAEAPHSETETGEQESSGEEEQPPWASSLVGCRTETQDNSSCELRGQQRFVFELNALKTECNIKKESSIHLTWILDTVETAV